MMEANKYDEAKAPLELLPMHPLFDIAQVLLVEYLDYCYHLDYGNLLNGFEVVKHED